MTQGVEVTITCQRCATVVPWAPHCPHCSAYLEFHGEPPWSPDGPVTEVIEVPVDDTPTAISAETSSPGEPDSPPHAGAPESTGASSEAATEAHASDADATDADTEAVPTVEGETATAEVTHATAHRSRWSVGLSIVALTILVALLLLVMGGAAGLIALPVILTVVLVALRSFDLRSEEHGQHGGEHEPDGDAGDADGSGASSDEAGLTWIDDDPGLEARAPQMVAPVMERSRPLAGVSTIARDVECEHCGRMNVSGHRFCDRCGGTLGEDPVAPPVVAVSAAVREAEEAKARRTRRRVSGSWRSPLLIGSLALAFVAALIFAFLGPGALQSRVGLTTVFQVIAQFIDPYAGAPARVESVTASSTLAGTNPSQVGFGDNRTFWASAPGPNYGAGATLRIEFADTVEINRMVIQPGIQSQQFDVRAVGTPRDITLTFDDGSRARTQLAPVDADSDWRQLLEFPDVTTKSVQMLIESVYPPRGKKEGGYGEVAIAGLQFLQTPQPPQVFRVQTGQLRTPAIPGVPAP